MDASFAGDAKRVSALLKSGADPNVISGTGHRYRPLHRAIEHKKTIPKHAGHFEVVKALLKAGADPKLRGGMERLTALQLAAIGETQFVPLLVEHMKPRDIFDACVTLDAARVRTLLKKDRALAKAKDDFGWMPLHLCASSAMHRLSPKDSAASREIAKLLLDAGVDPNEHRLFDNKWPLSAMYDACGRSNNAVVARVLFEAGGNACDGESVYHASDEGHAECLALIEEFVPRDKLAAECTSCLPAQLHWGRPQGMPWLLAHGADPNVLHSVHGQNALHKAVAMGARDEVIKMLLKYGARPEVEDVSGKSARDLVRAAKPAALQKRLLAALG
jgi:ankyrin repeat protein